PFRDGPDLWTGIHDVPCVRAVILEGGARIALVSVEAVLLDRELETQARRVVSQLTGIPADQIWLSATHTVSTPHFLLRPNNPPEENAVAARMREKLLSAVQAAVTLADGSLREASLGFGAGTCRANVNRSIETKDGWWLGSGEEWPADHSVPVIRIDGPDSEPIAILYNYNCELAVMDKSVMSDGGRHVTADLAGAASRFVENEYNGKTVALFLPGVSTDQGPAYRAVRTVRGRGGSWRTVDIKEAGWLLLELEGERLGEQVLVASEHIQCAALSRPIQMDHRTFWFRGQKMRGLPQRPDSGPVKQWPFEKAEDRTRSVELLLLGQTALVAADGIGVETAMAIKARSPFENTVLVSSVSGGAGHLPTDGAKYMAERSAYENVTFQARNSEFWAGSAEKMREDVLQFLNSAAGAGK
ncbi:MAG: hypothetical protein ACI4PH_07015, partial [Faecousia sp.]